MSGIPRSLLEVITKVVRGKLAEVHTTLPGKIVKWNSATGLASVELQIKTAVWDDDNQRTFEDPPILTDIPVQFPRGGGYVVSFPLAVGDFVTVFFSEASLAEWRTSGQKSEPVDARRMSIGWPFCIPGIYPDTKPLDAGDQTARDAGMVLGRDGHTEQIRFKVGEIDIGVGASDFVALKTLVGNELTAIVNKLNSLITAYNAHTHPVPGVTPGAGAATTSPTASSASSASSPGDTGATMVKAK